MIYYFNQFWTPQYKYQLLKWFKKHRPEWKQAPLMKMKKGQLYTIYFKIKQTPLHLK